MPLLNDICFNFTPVWLENLGVDPVNGEQYQRDPKGTSMSDFEWNDVLTDLVPYSYTTPEIWLL